MLCSSAAQAAEFCLAEKQLAARNRPSVFSRLGKRHPESEAAASLSELRDGESRAVSHQTQPRSEPRYGTQLML